MHPNGVRAVSRIRTSRTAKLPGNDTVVQCIKERASRLQGYGWPDEIEIQATLYETGEQFKTHADWFGDPNRTSDRETTIFAIMDSTCTDCGTHFPNIKVNWSEKDTALCKFFDCERSSLTTKAIKGTALLWKNIMSNGTGDPRTLHAGLPLPHGSKSGLNIWTYKFD